MNEDAEIPTDLPKEKKRSRKKQLYSDIKSLMEFYFSAANLSKDRWLSQRLAESDSIELTHFLNFNKIRALTNDVNHLVKALRSSDILEVSDDCKVRRTVPVQMKENVDDCIIYVEQIPPDSDHDWLKSLFSCYGPIDYVSIPKYSISKKCKGFAFIEFGDSASAQKAVEDYIKAGRYLSNDIEPKDLLSISTFEKKEPPQSNINVELKSEGIDESDKVVKKSNKRELKEVAEECPEEETNPKKLKLVDDNSDQLNIVEVTNPTEEEFSSDQCTLEASVDESKKKKNRKKKKKTKKNKITPKTTGFQILSKKDWKSLRNKYLNIQRDKLKKLKQHVKQKRFHNKSKTMKENSIEHAEEIKNVEESSDNLSRVPTSKDYIPGVIARIDVTEPIINLKQFKTEIKNKYEDVKYIDVKEGSFSAFIRLATSDAAKHLCEKSVWNNAEVLKDAEEFEYWEKLEKDRSSKVSKSKGSNNMTAPGRERGREKLLRKAEKLLGKHITFDDDDE